MARNTVPAKNAPRPPVGLYNPSTDRAVADTEQAEQPRHFWVDCDNRRRYGKNSTKSQIPVRAGLFH